MKKTNTILGWLIALGLTANLRALPQDPTPVNGQVQIQNGSNFVQILQQTPQAIINWGQFNIGLGETVRFLQPSQQAAILNRVTGLDPSVIQGVLQANGRVFLLNPNGILFGPNAVVDVGSFTASTLKMTDEDFLNGTYKLTQDRSLPLAALTNQGSIKVAEGGFVVLVSPLLDNQGLILAQAGQVQLGASTQATFSVDGRGQIQFAVPDGFDPQFQGGGQGGTVLLQPGQMSQLLSQVVTNPTLVEAGSFQPLANGQVLAHGAEGILLNSGTISTDGGAANGGTIRLDSSQATILPVGGLLSANSQDGNAGEVRLLSAGQTVSQGSISAAANGTGQGGFVEVSGKNLWLLGTINVASAQGTGGSILVDPTDITIIDGAGGTFDPNLPNPGNAGAGSVSVTGMQGFAAVTLNASNNVLYNGNGFTLPGTSLTVIAGNDILFTTAGTIQATTLTLQATRDVVVSGSPNAVGLTSSSGALTIAGGRDVSLSTSNDLNLFSPSQISITAGRDLSLSAPQGLTMRLNAPRTDLTATAGTVTLRSSNASPSSGPGNLTINGGNVSLLDNGNGTVFVSSGNVAINATNNFIGLANNGNFALQTTVNGINVTAGQSFSVNATGTSNIRANNGGGVTVAAPTVDIRGGNGVFVTAPGAVSLTANNGDLAVHGNANQLAMTSSNAGLTLNATGDVLLDTNNDLNLSSGTATLISAGRDLTLFTPGGLTMRLNSPSTTLNASRNLTLSSSAAIPSVPGTLTQNAGNITWSDPGNSSFAVRAGNLTVNATNNFTGVASSGNFEVRSSVSGVNITAGQNFSVDSTGTTVLQADNAGGVILSAQAVNIRGGNGVFITAPGPVSLNASNGDLGIHGVANQLAMASGSGGLTVNASRDVTLDTNNDLNLSSATATLINAGRDIALFTPAGLTTRFNSPTTTLNAPRNLTMRLSNVSPSVGGTVLRQNAGNVTWADPGNSGFGLRAGNVTVNATNDFTGVATNGNFDVQSTATGINITAGQNFSVDSTGTTVLQANNAGGLSLSAQAVNIRGGNGVFISAPGPVSLSASNGDLGAHGGANQLAMTSGNGGVTLNASRDVLLDTNNDLNFSSATATLVNAGRDIALFTPAGLTTRFNSPTTTLNAPRNLTMRLSNVSPSVGGTVLRQNAGNVTWADPGNSGFGLRAGNVTVNATNDFTGVASNGNFDVRSSVSGVNITAGQNFSVDSAGTTVLQADNAGGVKLTASNASLRAGNGIFVNGVSDVSLTATNGDAILHANSNQLQIGSSTGGVAVNASGDVVMDTNNDLNLGAATNNRLTAGRDLSLATPAGLTMRFDSPESKLVAGRNLTIASSNANYSVTPGALSLNAVNVSLLDPGNSSFSLRSGSFSANATQDVRGNAINGNFNLASTVGGVNVTAGGNFLVNASGGKFITANSDRLNIGAGNVALSGVTLTANNNARLGLSSVGNLSVGSLATGAGANATLSGANIIIDSMQGISGGNYTINTPGNLTEINAASNPPTLTGLNISAGRVFNTGNGNGKFSIPNVSTPGALAALVTAGNDSVFQSSASFQTFNGAVLNPGHIDHQTGDIYVNGILVYGGLPPIIPPDPPPPPSPPPVPVVVPEVVSPSTPQAAQQQQSQLTPEERAQILAQSNLALGNLGSFSRELSNAERSQLSARMDSLHQTWPLDPFSPTLALTVPGGAPAVYASELAQLQALLLMSTPSDDPLEKDRGAYNVIVDQELREIWEVRYWRHLLEGFIIWEDRE